MYIWSTQIKKIVAFLLLTGSKMRLIIGQQNRRHFSCRHLIKINNIPRSGR